MVVKWSAYGPSTPTIRVRILQTSKTKWAKLKVPKSKTKNLFKSSGARLQTSLISLPWQMSSSWVQVEACTHWKVLFNIKLGRRGLKMLLSYLLPLIYFHYFKTVFRIKTVHFSGIWPWIVGVEGKDCQPLDHYHDTSTVRSSLADVIKIFFQV